MAVVFRGQSPPFKALYGNTGEMVPATKNCTSLPTTLLLRGFCDEGPHKAPGSI